MYKSVKNLRLNNYSLSIYKNNKIKRRVLIFKYPPPLNGVGGCLSYKWERSKRFLAIKKV